MSGALVVAVLFVVVVPVLGLLLGVGFKPQREPTLSTVAAMIDDSMRRVQADIAREEVRWLQASRLSHTSASFWSGGSRDNGREIQAAKEAEWRAYGC